MLKMGLSFTKKCLNIFTWLKQKIKSGLTESMQSDGYLKYICKLDFMLEKNWGYESGDLVSFFLMKKTGDKKSLASVEWAR